MAKKRKSDSKSSEPTEPPQKQRQKDNEKEAQEQGQQVEEPQVQENVEVEGECDGDDDDGKEEKEKEHVGNEGVENREQEEDDEPIEKLLEPFRKEQLMSLLLEAAEKHRDVAKDVRKMADEDPAHRKIFVHGLGWDTKTENLIESFKQFGEIEDCRAVTDKTSGKSKGYGFILFKTRAGARKALEEPQKKIGSRMAACQLASVGPTQPQAAAAPPAPPPVSEYTQRKIYVSNVGPELDPRKLLAFFSAFGEIEEGPLGLDKATGKPKGFCLFVYKSAESARKALAEPHKNFEGHVLHCQKAIDGPKPGKSQNPYKRQHRNDNPASAAPSGGHLMAPAAPPQAVNPALGQALTALFTTQGAGVGLNPALGQAFLGTAAGLQGGYVSHQTNVNPVVMAGYGNQTGLQGVYPSQQAGQGGAGRGQHLAGQYGGMGHYYGQ